MCLNEAQILFLPHKILINVLNPLRVRGRQKTLTLMSTNTIRVGCGCGVCEKKVFQRKQRQPGHSFGISTRLKIDPQLRRAKDSQPSEE